MSKHTPGPWYHDFASGMKNGNAALIEYFVRRDGDSVSIAADIVDPDTRNPSEANARLIAAAPDLLSFVQEYIEAWEDGMAGDSFLLRAAKRVSDLATGGSNDRP